MESTNDILSQLKFIARIRPGTKIHVSDKRLEEPSWFTSLSRWLLWPDQRNNAYDFLEFTFARSFEILNSYLVSESISKQTQSRRIFRDIRLALGGVKALKQTYSSDDLFCCKLETLKEEVEALIEELESKKEITLLSESSESDDSRDSKDSRDYVDSTSDPQPPSFISNPYQSQVDEGTIEDVYAEYIPGSCV